MLSELVIVIIFAILGLMAHGARKHRWLEWFIRVVIVVVCGSEVYALSTLSPEDRANGWVFFVSAFCTVATGVVLLNYFRRGISAVLSTLNSIVTGGTLFALAKQGSSGVKTTLLTDPVFVAESIPHLNGFFLYVSTIFYLLTLMSPATEFGAPSMPLPLPVELTSLFNYNWLGLMLLSVCGCGVFVARKPKELWTRLGYLKPSWQQVGIGLGIIVFTFCYDLVWSLFTHNASGDLGAKLLNYNAGTFGVVGGVTPSVILAIATAICAGMGEETLIRGALQPVLGIVPAAVLHGVLHGQFAHAPMLIIQVALWSCCVGVVRRYTNTTTTIIGHAGFNLITVFLFAFNP